MRSRSAALGLFLLITLCLTGVVYGQHTVVGGDPGGNFLFNPADLTINMGENVKWIRDATLCLGDHSSTSGSCAGPPCDNDPSCFDCTPGATGPGPGLTWDFFPLPCNIPTASVTYHRAGNYPYFCAVHPNVMRGIIRVNKANSSTSVVRTVGGSPTTFGQSVTFTVTVTSAAPLGSRAIVGSPTGTVNLRSNGNTVQIASLVPSGDNVNSNAVIAITSLPVGPNQAIDAVYTSDANFNGSTDLSPVTHTVTQATPTVTLTNPTNPSTLGQSVTFTARVSGLSTASAAPAGNVTFRNGLTVLGTGALSSSGQPAGQAVATFNKSDLPVGTHDIKADYPGNTNYTAANDTALSPGQQVVNKGTPTVSVSSNAPTGAIATQTVTFTAVVSGPVVTPTGTVTFFDGMTAIPGDASLSGGIATKNVNTLSGGSHTLSARYNGDVNFNINTGNLGTNPQMIRDFSISITPSTLANGTGQTATYSGTLTSIAGYGPRTVNLSCGSGAPVPCTPNPNSVSVPSGGTMNFSVGVSSSSAPPATFNFPIVGQDALLPALQRQQSITFNVVDTKVDLQASANHDGNPEPIHVGKIVQLNTSVRNATVSCPQTPPCVASNVVVQVSFSSPVTGISASPSMNCTQGPAPITCSFTTLGQGSTQGVTLQFAAPFVRFLNATISVSSNDGEQQNSDNVITDPINIRLRPWLRVPLKLP